MLSTPNGIIYLLQYCLKLGVPDNYGDKLILVIFQFFFK